jgi:hypothetical protein
MRNQLVVDLVLAGPNIVPDPTRWGTRDSAQTLFGSAEEQPVDRRSGIDCRLIGSLSDSARAQPLGTESVEGIDIPSDLWFRPGGG